MPAVLGRAEERPTESFGDPACTWVTLFSADRTPTHAMTCGVVELAPGSQGLGAHYHAQAEIYYLVSGEGVVTVDGVESRLRPGEAAFIPGDAVHSLRNVGADTLRLFYVFPCDSFSEVVYRYPPST